MVIEIFKLLDMIEDKTKIMIHEIPELGDKMNRWQRGEYKDSFFKETLNRYWDSINNQ